MISEDDAAEVGASAAPEAGTLPPLDFMRGYVAARADIYGARVPLDFPMAFDWFDALLAEVEQLRTLLADTDDDDAPELSPAQARVYRLMRSTNMSIEEIAKELHIGVETVRTHRNAIYTKLQVHSRSELRALPRT